MMAVKWDGFSEEDISKMKSHSDVPYVDRRRVRDPNVKHKYDNDVNSKKNIEVTITSNPPPDKSCDDTTVIAQQRAADAPTEVSTHCEEHFQRKAEVAVNLNDHTPILENCDSSTGIPPQSEVKGIHNKSLTAKLVIPSISEPPPSSINLSEFTTKHRLMEEQNRARRVFLAKALEDRKKQTHAEQRRLGMIQEELLKLDQRLSCDVSILRNQIEAASVEFMEAQKRYDRAEKEFLDAKLLLYTKLERKDLLTHHLCTIIEQNEMRKAQKLSELMEKLQMPETDGSQIQEEATVKQDKSAKEEPKRKVSSEIILTPASVVPH